VVDRRSRANELGERIGRWLISSVAWGPLLLWVLWPSLDVRFSWHPLVGVSSVAALLVAWVYTARYGLAHSKVPTWIALGIIFDVCFAVAAQAGEFHTFAAISLILGSPVGGIVCGLIVIVAVRLVRIRDYGALEDALLLSVPLTQSAIVVGTTVGVVSADRSALVLGIAAGLMFGLMLSILNLAWIYGILGLISSWLAKYEDDSPAMWWVGEN
jgi:hypothetical protein